MKLWKLKRLRLATVAAVAAFACVQTFGAGVSNERKNVETVVPGSAESAPENDASITFSARSGEFLSEEWRADFATPPRAFRPLQIVHGRDLSDPSEVAYFRDACGLGGLVVNVGGADYIRSQENWDRFCLGVKNLKEAGMRAWIYDEDGYPSLSAGGVVLEGRPDLRALELAYDPEHDPPYYVRDCYEYTHSSNNVFKARRYPNPLNPEATARFIDVTHRRYRAELKDLYDYVEAFFTDEPAMMAANLGVIREEDIRSRVPTIDPLDPDKKELAVVSWCDDVEARYQEKYGEELRPNLKSLFEGDSDADRKTRRQFWTLLGELDAERYYAQIQKFCHEDPNGPVASGHTLYEENLIMHVPLDGNKIEVLKKFDLPGMDMLNSDPVAYFYGCWAAAAFPCSAAAFIGNRRVMTEISDFSQQVSGDRKPVPLDAMEAVAGWQAAFGVTEFTLYYGIKAADYRNEGTHRDYCRFVGRLNAVLRDATPDRPILLYYPIEEMQEEFRPYNGSLTDLSKQSERCQQIFNSFNTLGAGLSRIQTSFYVIDRKTLKSLTKTPDDPEEAERLRGKFSGIIFPRHSEKIDYDWAEPNFREYWVEEDAPINVWEDVARLLGDFSGPRLTAEPSCPSFVEGAFKRDGREIFVVTNADGAAWNGVLRLTGTADSFESKRWTALDPKSGAIETFDAEENAFPAAFAGRQTLIFVSPRIAK